MLEKIKNRRTELLATKEQILANLNAIIGAINLCDELISEIEIDG